MQATSIATLVDSTKSGPRALKDALNNLVIRVVASGGACSIGNYIDLEIISAAGCHELCAGAATAEHERTAFVPTGTKSAFWKDQDTGGPKIG